MIKHFTDFYESFHFLRTHQINIGPISGTNYTTNKFFDSLDISVVKVNPETEMIDEDNNLNTDTRVWLEFGPYDFEENCKIHDCNLDCGAPTYEEAIIKLANLVNIYYNKYGEERPLPKTTIKNTTYIVCDNKKNPTDYIVILTQVYDEYNRKIKSEYTLINKHTNICQKETSLSKILANYELIEIKNIKENEEIDI